MSLIKKIFISGIAVVVPIALTLWVMFGVFGGIDSWINSYLQDWFGFSFIGLGLLLTLGVTFTSGLFVSTWFGNFIVKTGNKVIYKLPVINKIYKLAKETIDVITTKQAFKTVVRVEFPRVGLYSIGFLTNKNTIFIPTTPNPTSGFLIQTDKYEILPDMTVENAIRYIVSMGTIGGEGNGQS
jgi:uncharacterized membrane protein